MSLYRKENKLRKAQTKLDKVSKQSKPSGVLCAVLP